MNLSWGRVKGVDLVCNCPFIASLCVVVCKFCLILSLFPLTRRTFDGCNLKSDQMQRSNMSVDSKSTKM